MSKLLWAAVSVCIAFVAVALIAPVAYRSKHEAVLMAIQKHKHPTEEIQVLQRDGFFKLYRHVASRMITGNEPSAYCVDVRVGVDLKQRCSLGADGVWSLELCSSFDQ
jgi:hypothetical protein